MATITLADGFDFVGLEIPLRFKVGQLVEILIEIRDTQNEIQNVTGRSYQAKIGNGGGGAAIATFSYVVVDGPAGLVHLSLDTSPLTAGEYVMEVMENNTNYLWGGPVEILSKEIV